VIKSFEMLILTVQGCALGSGVKNSTSLSVPFHRIVWDDLNNCFFFITKFFYMRVFVNERNKIYMTL
jgi:hypothetical protein